jgi:hypothetical protein
MPTELRDAWPGYEKNEELCAEKNPTISARQVETTDHEFIDVYTLIDDMKKEQSQRMTIFTVIMIVMMLSLMNQVDALKKDIRLLVAAQRRTF